MDSRPCSTSTSEIQAVFFLAFFCTKIEVTTGQGTVHTETISDGGEEVGRYLSVVNFNLLDGIPEA
jgi:hypothetical protein